MAAYWLTIQTVMAAYITDYNRNGRKYLSEHVIPSHFGWVLDIVSFFLPTFQ